MNSFIDRVKDSVRYLNVFLSWWKILPDSTVSPSLVTAVSNYYSQLQLYLESKCVSPDFGDTIKKAYNAAETEAYKEVKSYYIKEVNGVNKAIAGVLTDDIASQYTDTLLELLEQDAAIVEELYNSYQSVAILRRLSDGGKSVSVVEPVLNKIGSCGHPPHENQMNMNLKTHQPGDFLDVLLWIELNRNRGYSSPAVDKDALEALRSSLLTMLFNAKPTVQLVFVSTAAELEKRLRVSSDPEAPESLRAAATLLREFDSNPAGNLYRLYCK